MTQKDFRSKVEGICSCMEQESREQMIEELWREYESMTQCNNDNLKIMLGLRQETERLEKELVEAKKDTERLTHLHNMLLAGYSIDSFWENSSCTDDLRQAVDSALTMKKGQSE